MGPVPLESCRQPVVPEAPLKAPDKARGAHPPPLTVEEIAQIVTVPSGLTRPVRLRRPSVAGAQGSPVAALMPVGYPGTVYGWPRFRPDWRVYASFHIPAWASKTHFSRPAVVEAAAAVYLARRRRERVGTGPLVGDVGGGVVGEPQAEGEHGRRCFRQRRREAGKDAHVARKAGCCHRRGVVGQRRGRKRCARLRQPHAVRARRAGRVDEVHGVDAVAAAALRVVQDVVVDADPAEVVVLANLVCRIDWVTLKLPTGVGAPGLCAASGVKVGVAICAPAPITMPAGCGLPPLPAFPAMYRTPAPSWLFRMAARPLLPL